MEVNLALYAQAAQTAKHWSIALQMPLRIVLLFT